jgi:hypothetical protein
MFAPKTIWAVVGVTVAFNFFPAMPAGKVLDFFYEFVGHKKMLA